MSNDYYIDEPDEEYARSNYEAAWMEYEYEMFMRDQEYQAEQMREAADMRRKELRENGS